MVQARADHLDRQHAVDKLYTCADCGTCQSHCVTDQPLPAAVALARAEVAEQGLAPAALYPLNEAIGHWGNPCTRRKSLKQLREPVTSPLFVGDDGPYLWPEGSQAALTLLHTVGIDPVLIGAGRNSGYLPSSLGFP